MSDTPEREPFSESQLDSPQYRERLMRKLNCLIAVLEVATTKVQKSLAGPDPDVDRLKRIQSNLQGTLEVCVRARTALERREALPKDLPENLATVVGEDGMNGDFVPKHTWKALPEGSLAEMSSREERSKFERLGRIEETEIRSCDLEELSRLLQN